MRKFVSNSDKFNLIKLIEFLHDKNRLFCEIRSDDKYKLGICSVVEYRMGIFPGCWDVMQDSEVYYCKSFLKIVNRKNYSNNIYEVRFSVDAKFNEDSTIHSIYELKNSHSPSLKYNFINEIRNLLKRNHFIIKSNDASITDYIKYVYGILNER